MMIFRSVSRRAAHNLSALAMALICAGCAVNPVSGRPEAVVMSSADEVKIGQEAAKEVESSMGLTENHAVQSFVQVLGKRLVPESPRQDVIYSFHVVEQEEPNAFALPGGPVFVTRGLLPLLNTEDELAGVMGHEISHVAARHAVRQVTRAAPFSIVAGITGGITSIVSPMLGNVVGGVIMLPGGVLLAPYGRSQEREADEIGQEIAAKAGYDPAALSTFLSTLEREVVLQSGKPHRRSWFDSHPATPERVKDTAARAKTLKRVQRAPISRDQEAFLRHFDGLVVGTNPRQGIFKDELFLQPELGFVIRFPKKWDQANTPQFVAAAEPRGAAQIMVTLARDGNDPIEAVWDLSQKANTNFVEKTTKLTINGLPAARLVVDVNANGRAKLEATWIAYGGHIFMIAAQCARSSYDDYHPIFEAAAGSFRPITREERNQLTVRRLRLVHAHDGEILSALARRTGSAWSEEEIAVSNGLPSGATLKQGQTVKVAIEEPYHSATQ